MRFEFTVALKYLIPKWRHLSVSIISLVSVLVISLVVWLVLLFLSVTAGIEKKWVEELVSLNAPLRMTPNERYYHSYYYNIDAQALDGGYSLKTIQEKLNAPKTNPYDPTIDAELPKDFPAPDLDADGNLKDIVKEGWGALSTLKSARVRPQEYEVGFANLRLNLFKEESGQQSFVTQVCYVSSFDGQNQRLQKMVLPTPSQEYKNFKTQLGSYAEPFAMGAQNLPSHPVAGEGLLVAKHFQSNGVHLGDRGTLTYYTPAGGSMKEQRISIYVAGFYDPGIMPVGNRLLFADRNVTALLRSNISVTDHVLGNGIHIWVDDLEKTQATKQELTTLLKERGIENYWSVESFQDYEFAKPLLQQLKSDKNLFTLIAVIILIVACSNIISMLILLVNDKRKEIGILQSMGASPKSIALIFGICGFTTGLLSSAIGTCAAILTLKNLQSLVDFLSLLQGHEAFQKAFFGSALPNELSVEALIFVIISTLVISLLAGIIPAIKAARIRPAEILRNE